MLKSLICVLLIVMMGVACSSADKKMVMEAVEPCIGLEGEELRDCLVDRAKELTEEIVDKADD